MKYPNNIKKQMALMKECVEFLVDERREYPYFANMRSDDPKFIKSVEKTERKALRSFAKHFDPEYFADSLSIWSRLKKREGVKEIDALDIMHAFHYACEQIRDCDFYMVDIAERALHRGVKEFAMNQINDQSILYDFSKRRDHLLAKLAKQRLEAINKAHDESPKNF